MEMTHELLMQCMRPISVFLPRDGLGGVEDAVPVSCCTKAQNLFCRKGRFPHSTTTRLPNGKSVQRRSRFMPANL